MGMITNLKRKKEKNRNKGGLTLVGFLALGFCLGAVLHLNLGCWDSFNAGIDDREEPIDKEGIETAALDIENAFLDADTAALADVLTDTSLEIYKNTFEEIMPYMADFAEAFKSRKLLYANQIFAVYEFKAEGKTHTVEMTRYGDKGWKLTRF